MNIPGVYRKAVDGFIIPPRTFFQMFVSAAQGAVSLFDETHREEFIGKLDKGTINEAVISQATAGPVMMLSLYNDLQSPHFKRQNFDSTQFLEGVGPALANFHNMSGSLENELHKLQQEAKEKNNGDDEEKKDADESEAEKNAKEETEAILSAFRAYQGKDSFASPGEKHNVSAVLDHDWMDDAKKEPESMAGQLSRMLTTELFQIHQISAKTAFLLQNQAFKFQEGSCTVNNVALLSARAFSYVEREDLDESDGDDFGPKYELVDYDMDEEMMKSKGGGVAAQMEVLYDVTSEFLSQNNSESEEGQNEDDAGKLEPEATKTTIVSVATLEGWLTGGPNGELRWRLALHRPAFEFPGIQQAY